MREPDFRQSHARIEMDRQRIDKWLWHARVVRTRSAAAALADAGLPADLIEAWADQVSACIDLDAILRIAREAGELEPVASAASRPAASDTRARCRIGLALDAAFQFYYDDNLNRLEELGAELVRFSPIDDAQPPQVDGLYFGGPYYDAVHAIPERTPAMSWIP